MGNIWRKIKKYFGCLRLLIRIRKLVGDVDLLQLRLAEMERDILSGTLVYRCSHCGSTELEPIRTHACAEGAEVTQFRCKACGLGSSAANSS